MTSQLSGVTPWRRFYRTTRVTQPAAGAAWTYLVPAGELHQLVSVYATLTASAVVANRFPQLSYSDGSVIYLALPAQAAAVASSVTAYGWAPAGFGVSQNNVQLGILPDVPLQEGESISPVTSGLDGGDQWSAIFVRALVTQWKDGAVNLADLSPMQVVVVNPSE